MYDVIDTAQACLGLSGFLLDDAEVVAGSDGKITTGLGEIGSNLKLTHRAILV